ncbi:MAG: hypothetical protein SFY56_05470 [Bacteroidota bacterium]|nr:hypothetical protein [Bacteroidota bacterium]
MKNVILTIAIMLFSISKINAQTYNPSDIEGTWELSDKKAKIIFSKNNKFTYTWKGLTKEDSFNGTYKLVKNGSSTTIEFKRSNGAGWPSKKIKSLSADKKKIELQWGTLVEVYNKL